MNIKGIIVLICLIAVSGIVIAGDPGVGITASSDAGWNGVGSGEHTITDKQDTNTDCYCGTIPDWYAIGTDLCVKIGNQKVGADNCGNSDDFDGDSCENYEEYLNFLEVDAGRNPIFDCYCNHNNVCNANLGETAGGCPGDCTQGVPNGPEFSIIGILVVLIVAGVGIYYIKNKK